MIEKERLILSLFIFISIAKCDLCPWEYPDLQLWSDWSSWENGSPPIAGENFSIKRKILLDVETPNLGTITIIDGGMLIFSPKHKVYSTPHLKTTYFKVHC